MAKLRYQQTKIDGAPNTILVDRDVVAIICAQQAWALEQQTHEREFLRYKKITADGRQLDVDPRDLYDLLELNERADRVLPNGLCLLAPRQTCERGNACLTCDKFATDATYLAGHTQQLARLDHLSRTAARRSTPRPAAR